MRYAGHLVVILCLLLTKGVLAADLGPRYAATSAKPFGETVDDLLYAIGGENFRVTDSNRVGSVIAERGYPSFPDSIVVHFCNLEYARLILSRAPDKLLDMPCRVVVAERDDHVVVETRLLAEDPRLGELVNEINDILRNVVDTAVE
jgi:uncharacterized protein (DUF302 family)